MLNPLAWLLGFFLPACAAVGAAGLPTPAPVDVAHIVRPTTPNTALAAPQGWSPAPDLVTPRFEIPAPRLYAAIRKVAAAMPRTFPSARFDHRFQADWVVRSRVFNFPDLVTAQVIPAGADSATLVLYSRSVYGHSDLGVNLARLRAWLAALDASLPTPTER
jgi:uncharacterized protein (DUF1499 family)